MADKQVQVKDSQGTYHEVEVHNGGWSSFWKWFGIILVALIFAGVVMYIVDAWVTTDANDTQAELMDEGADINLNIGTSEADDGGEASSSE